MAGYLIGLGFLGFAGWLWWHHRFPSTSTPLTGTVEEEVFRVSTKTGRKSRSYGPRVSYIHPGTGTESILEPVSFGRRRFVAGEPVDLAYDPESGEVTRPDPPSWRETAVLVAVGVGFILAEWRG